MNPGRKATRHPITITVLLLGIPRRIGFRYIYIGFGHFLAVLGEPRRMVLAGSLCLLLVLTGCFSPENSEPIGDETEQDGLVFSWSPSPDAQSAVFRIEVIAGADTTCDYSYRFRSQGGAPEGITYAYTKLPESTLRTLGHSQLAPASVHAGPLNSGQVTYVDPFKGSSASGDLPIANESYITIVRAYFGTLVVADDEPWVQVICDSHDAKVRFYEADEYAAVYSPYSTEGAGLAVYPGVPTSDSLHVNHGDRYDVDTQGDIVHVGLISFPYESATMPYQTGHLLLATPEGEEEVDLDDHDGGILREYNSTGSYGLYMERIAVGYTPLGGLMAGFVIHTDLGDLETMPDGFYLD